MQKFGRLVLMTLATTLLSVSLAMPVMAADVTGTWAVTLSTDGGAGAMNLVLEQEGEMLKGNVTGDVGNAPVNGKVENETISFSHDLPDYGIAAAYKGELTGNTIKGTVDFGGGAATGTFTAERKEADK